MPKGPKGEKRPADLNKLAASIVGAATEGENITPPRGQAGGRIGGKARSEQLTPSQRSEIARKAAKARWAHKKE